MNEFVNTEDQSSCAAGADATNEELSRSTAPEEKNTEKYIQTMDKLIKAMVQSTLLQKNVNKTIKDGLPKLQEAQDSLVESRRATSTAHGRLKESQKVKRRATNAISPESAPNQPRRPRAKPVLVKPAEGKTNADVLQKIKDAVNPSTTHTVFKPIRCIRGDVVLELQSTQNKTQFSDEVRRAVGSDATDVRDSIPKTTIEIRDIDASATVDEVRQAITQAGVGGEIEIRITDANNRGQRLAIASVQETEALKSTQFHYLINKHSNVYLEKKFFQALRVGKYYAQILFVRFYQHFHEIRPF